MWIKQTMLYVYYHESSQTGRSMTCQLMIKMVSLSPKPTVNPLQMKCKLSIDTSSITSHRGCKRVTSSGQAPSVTAKQSTLTHTHTLAPDPIGLVFCVTPTHHKLCSANHRWEDYKNVTLQRGHGMVWYGMASIVLRSRFALVLWPSAIRKRRIVSLPVHRATARVPLLCKAPAALPRG